MIYAGYSINVAMNLIPKIALSVFILFSGFTAICQTDFRPGYVITNNNDTLRGFIDYRGDARNSKKCDFKETRNGVVQEFLPFSIKGYRFNESKYFISKCITSDSTKIQLFLEFLVDGIANLYYYHDSANPHYFIEKEDGKLHELTNEHKRVRINEAEYVRETKSYIGMLTFAFADCHQLFPLINKAKLNDKSLIELTKKYHEYVCNSEKCVIYEKLLPSVRVRIAPFVSMNSSYLRIGNNPLYETVKFKAANYPTLGVLLNTSLPKASEKLSFQLSGEFGKGYFYGAGDYNPYSSTNLTFEEVQIHTSLLTLKAGLKYTYPIGKIRPTLNIGGNLVKLINKNGKRIEDYQYYSTIYTSETQDVPLPDFMVGFHAELGVDFRVSTALTAFLNLGFLSSMNTNGAWGPQSRIDNDSSAYLKTFQLNAGIYF